MTVLDNGGQVYEDAPPLVRMYEVAAVKVGIQPHQHCMTQLLEWVRPHHLWTHSNATGEALKFFLLLSLLFVQCEYECLTYNI